MRPSELPRIRVDALTPYARNSRTHSAEQIGQIAASIQEFGFVNPVLIDGQGTIIAGHGRVMAAERLGMVDVPVLMLDELTEAQRRAYVIADNKIGLGAGWDEAALKAELEALLDIDFDLDALGFQSNEIDDLLAGATDFEPSLNPTSAYNPVTEEQMAKGTAKLSNQFGAAQELMDVMCPHCAKEFHIERPK
jgi:ParB-like chromosome segregation protein Spo0J